MTRRRGWRLLTALGLVVPLAAAGASLRGGAFEPPRPAAELGLPGPDGREVRLAQYRGQVVALSFGYTHCADVCPTVLADLAHARGKLGPRAGRVQVLYVTVDPARDTRERMAAYTGMFDPSFVGLTGAPERLRQVWQAWGVSVAPQPPTATGVYAVHHSAFVYLVDARGRLRSMLPFGTPGEDLAHDLGVLVQEAAAAEAPVIEVATPWVRRAPMIGKPEDSPATRGGSAAYLSVVNRGSQADALVAARLDAAEAVEIHETRTASGMVTMARVDRLPIGPGARLELKPGGYHLMLIGLRRSLQPGQTVTLTLVFERAGPRTVRAEVR